MLNFTINTQKKPLHQIFQMEKFLTHSYSELLSITAHYSINLKQKNYILFQQSLFPFFFSSFFSLLSHFPLLSFLVASVSLNFTVWALPLQGSSIRNSKPKCHWTINPLRLRSVVADMEVELDGGVIWFCGFGFMGLSLWVSNWRGHQRWG